MNFDSQGFLESQNNSSCLENVGRLSNILADLRLGTQHLIQKVATKQAKTLQNIFTNGRTQFTLAQWRKRLPHVYRCRLYKGPSGQGALRCSKVPSKDQRHEALLIINLHIEVESYATPSHQGKPPRRTTKTFLCFFITFWRFFIFFFVFKFCFACFMTFWCFFIFFL